MSESVESPNNSSREYALHLYSDKRSLSILTLLKHSRCTSERSANQG